MYRLACEVSVPPVGRMLVMISQDVLDWNRLTQHQRRVKRHDTMQIGELLENYLPRSPQQFKRRLHNSVREGSDVHQTREASGRDVIRAVPIVIAVAVTCRPSLLRTAVLHEP